MSWRISAGRRVGTSRNLLFTETDEYGNVIDPNTKNIITVAGGKTPYPLPPWLSQTPVVLEWMNITSQPVAKDQETLQQEGPVSEMDAATQQRSLRDDSSL